MNKPIIIFTGSLLLLAGVCLRANGNSNGADSSGQFASDVSITSRHDAPENDNITPVPIGAQALMNAYPDFIKGYENGKILYADGSSDVSDDGREKDFTTMLDNSDPENMFYIMYSQPSDGESPEYLADAGRSRNEVLFKKLYGNSSAAVQKKLVNVAWFGQNVKFISVNGAADQLKKVAAALAKYPELRKYLKSSGSFYWHPVRGAKRLSAHSYVIAFDIAVDYSDYWLWKNPGAKETDRIKYSNRILRQIVDIIRKHGGGAWYHFDTMHFEYRPEILEYTRLSTIIPE